MVIVVIMEKIMKIVLKRLELGYVVVDTIEKVWQWITYSDLWFRMITVVALWGMDWQWKKKEVDKKKGLN